VEGPLSPEVEEVHPAPPARVTIREVGPRDGLQAEQPLPVGARVRLIEAVGATGVPKIEAVSFVSPKAVPAMADAAAVWARVTPVEGVAYSALVPNRRGAEEAVRAGGFASLQAFIAASDGYNRRNLGKTVEESLEDVMEVLRVGRGAGIPVECTISAAFGDPYEGEVPARAERVIALASRLVEAGAAGISLGDTTGLARPDHVRQMVGTFLEGLTGVPLNLHFHETGGTGSALANVVAAMEVGAEEFDASVGGMGGSPFAPGAGGNVATEDLVRTLSDMGIESGVDLDRVLDAARLAESLVGHPLPSRRSAAGRPRSGGDV